MASHPIQGLGLGSLKTRYFPDYPVKARGWTWIDDFNRQDLVPNTSTNPFYATAGTGTEVIAVSNTAPGLSMTTGSSTGNDVSIFADQFGIQRLLKDTGSFNQFSRVIVDMIVNLGNAVGLEMFIGLLDSSVAITAIPTTARHLGMYFDDTALANFELTAADGTTQTTVDTTEAADTDLHRLRIDWTGLDAATLSWFPIDSTTATATQTVSAIAGTNDDALVPHFYVEAEGNAAESIVVTAWSVQWK